MESELTPCDPDGTLSTLAASVGVLLHGVPRNQLSILPQFDSLESREPIWRRFIAESLPSVQTSISKAYQAATANRNDQRVELRILLKHF